MSREYKTELTITCDRCGAKAVFILETQAEESNKWKTWSNGDFLLNKNTKSFVLCPNCSYELQQTFMKWFPDAFKKAFEE